MNPKPRAGPDESIRAGRGLFGPRALNRGPHLADGSGMLWGTRPAKAADHAAGFQARRHQRYRTADLACPLGQVVDLSAAGARVRGDGKPPLTRGAAVQMSLAAGGQSIRVGGRIAWLRRSWSGFEIGVEFTQVDQAAADALEQLARFGFIGGRARPTPSPAHGVSAAIQVEDLYAVLGVPRDADAEIIQSAYRTLARRFHPDVSPEPHAQDRFALLSKAYSVLRDPSRRRRYDALLARCA